MLLHFNAHFDSLKLWQFWWWNLSLFPLICGFVHWVNLITVGFKFIFQIILKTLKYPSSWTGWHSDHLYHRFVEFRRLTERNIAIKEVNYEMCSSQDNIRDYSFLSNKMRFSQSYAYCYTNNPLFWFTKKTLRHSLFSCIDLKTPLKPMDFRSVPFSRSASNFTLNCKRDFVTKTFCNYLNSMCLGRFWASSIKHCTVGTIHACLLTRLGHGEAYDLLHI